MENNFEWTPKLIAEYGQFYHSGFSNPSKYMGLDMMEEFIKSKTNEDSVILRTEDGADVKTNYKGNLWRVFTAETSYENWKPYDLPSPKYPVDGEKYFVFLKSAKEYILLNKPVLSLNDLLSVWEHPVDLSDDSKVSPLFERFKKIAQSKINQ